MKKIQNEVKTSKRRKRGYKYYSWNNRNWLLAIIKRKRRKNPQKHVFSLFLVSHTFNFRTGPCAKNHLFRAPLIFAHFLCTKIKGAQKLRELRYVITIIHCVKAYWIQTENCFVFIRIKTCIAHVLIWINFSNHIQ